VPIGAVCRRLIAWQLVLSFTDSAIWSLDEILMKQGQKQIIPIQFE
jgi:hypothetical protein